MKKQFSVNALKEIIDNLFDGNETVGYLSIESDTESGTGDDTVFYHHISFNVYDRFMNTEQLVWGIKNETQKN